MRSSRTFAGCHSYSALPARCRRGSRCWCRPQFFRIGARLVTIAALPLALGICADLGVVLQKITESAAAAASGATVSLAALIGLWFIYPMLQMRRVRAGS